MNTNNKNEQRLRRRRRIRARVRGTAERPRLAVFRSNRFLSAQLIDDTAGHTLAAVSTREASGGKPPRDRARAAGEAAAAAALKRGIKRAVFDRGGYGYRGAVQELAEGARVGGLEF